MLAGESLDLLALLVDNLGGIGNVMVNELLVHLVDEGSQEEDGGGDKRQTPEWDDLDQVVRDEGSNARSNGHEQVLSEEDLLCLDNEKVDELVDVTNHRVQSLPRYCVVFSGTDSRGKANRQDSLATSFCQDSETKHHIGDLEGISDDVEVSSSEDECDDKTIGNCRGSWVLP